MVARIAGARNRLSSRAVDARRAVIGMALLCACGASAPRLSRFATVLPRGLGASSFDEPTRALFERSLGDRPTRERVHARLELLAMAPELSPDEARALLESTLDWLDWVRRGEVPDWVEVSVAERPTGSGDETADLLVSMTTPTPDPTPTSIERVASAIRGSRGWLARSASPELLRAWRAAMVSIHGAQDECSEADEEGALAVALEEMADRTGHDVAGPVLERTLTRASVACHVATLDGGIRLTRDDGEAFVLSCWARGGPPDRACSASPGAELASEAARGVGELESEERALVVVIGSALQAERYVVVWRDGAWRVRSVDLAWAR